VCLSKPESVHSKELDCIYRTLRERTPGVQERSQLVIDNFQKVLLRNFEGSIEGYFWKRKSYYFDKKDNLKSSFLNGLLSKMKFHMAKYDRRYFKLDVKSLMFSYAKD